MLNSNIYTLPYEESVSDDSFTDSCRAVQVLLLVLLVLLVLVAVVVVTCTLDKN